MPLKMHQDDLPTINLTPMIDIVFQLIIFFMVGTRFTEMEKKIDLSVPAVSNTSSLAEATEKQVINVYRDGRVELDQQPVTLDQLEQRLAEAKRQQGQLSVIVRGDAEGSFQSIAAVLTACRQAGVSDMGICVRVAKRER